MKRIVYSAALLFLSNAASAESSAVLMPNYFIATQIVNNTAGNTLNLSAYSRYPLSQHTGMSFTVGVVDSVASAPYSNAVGTQMGLSLFARDPSVGMLLFGYNYFNDASGSTTGDTDSTILVATYYFSSVDLSMIQALNRTTYMGSYNTKGIGGKYYLTDNLAFSLSSSVSDLDTTYAFGVTYQPAFFNNSLSINGSYNRASADSFGFGLAYYFDTRVSLKERSRKY